MKSPIKRHGGSYYIASKMDKLIPPHKIYVEPYFGSGAFLFRQDPTNKIEVVNDLDGDLVRFWLVLQDPLTSQEFIKMATMTPFCEATFEIARDYGQKFRSSIEKALSFFIVCRQSFSARGKHFAPIVKNRTRRGMCENASAWLSAVEGLPEVHKRLQRVVILNRQALSVIEEFDREDAFVLADPPWLHSTRVTTTEYGENEMSEENHRFLLERLVRCKAKVMLLGYESDLYDNYLKTWTIHKFPMANHSGTGKIKSRRTPVCWLNY